MLEVYLKFTYSILTLPSLAALIIWWIVKDFSDTLNSF